MFVADINYLAVIVSTIVAMAIGAFWYSPVLFGNKWMQMTGIQPDQTKAAKGYIAAALLNLLMVYVLAHFIDYVGATTILTGAVTGLWCWVGFIATAMGINYTFEHRPSQIFWINAGMSLVNLLVTGAILAIWA